MGKYIVPLHILSPNIPSLRYPIVSPALVLRWRRLLFTMQHMVPVKTWRGKSPCCALANSDFMSMGDKLPMTEEKKKKRRGNFCLRLFSEMSNSQVPCVEHGLHSSKVCMQTRLSSLVPTSSKIGTKTFTSPTANWD